MPDNVAAAEAVEDPRPRVKRLFEFLRALDERRNPIPMRIADHRWTLDLSSLPEHDTVQLARSGQFANGQDDGQTWFLRVSRPRLTEAPKPPGALSDWLRPGWETWDGTVSIFDSRHLRGPDGAEVDMLFDDDPDRRAVLDDYVEIREMWQQSESIRRLANELFEKLYGLWGDLRREGETSELLLGNAILRVVTDVGEVHHPLVVAPVQLQFDSAVPEFRLVDAGHPPEFYHPVFRRLADVSGSVQNDIRAAFEREPIHPFADRDVLLQWCRRTVQWLGPGGEVADTLPDEPPAKPLIGECPILFVRSRAHGYGAALEAILRDIDVCDVLPPVLREVVAGRICDADYSGELTDRSTAADPLFALPSNKEQSEIARRIQQHAGVVVQGPPGTGKTHTIANLIGHYLAQGKRVLVTSHTAKALRVLRDKLPCQLRSLCVSVLESDLASRDELKHAIHEITSMLSVGSIDEQRARRDVATVEYERWVSELAELRAELYLARSDEYRPIVVAGKDFTPAEAARFIAGKAEKSDWIPSPVSAGSPLPLSEAEVHELYATNAVPVADERELIADVPDLHTILHPDEVDRRVAQLRHIREQAAPLAELWVHSDHSLVDLQDLKIECQQASRLLTSDTWLLHVIHDSRVPETAAVWHELLESIDDTVKQARGFRAVQIEYGPELSAESVDDQVQTLEQLLTHVQNGGSLTGLKFRLLHGSWNNYLDSVRINAMRPKSVADLNALLSCARLQLRRKDLGRRWARQVCQLGGPAVQSLTQIEAILAQYCDTIRQCLNWYRCRWMPLSAALDKCGIDWNASLALSPPIDHICGDLLRWAGTLENVVIPQLDAAARTHEAANVHAGLIAAAEVLSGDTYGSDVAGTLARALQSLDTDAYRRSWNRLRDVLECQALVARRRDLLTRVQPVAPAWAAAIESRTGTHGNTVVAASASDAWLWRQFSDELDRRTSRSLTTVAQQIGAATRKLERATAELIETSAWVEQRQRMSRRPDAVQALHQWAQATARATGTGRQAIRLRMTIPSLMTRCREAVPVWIMQLNRVVEHCDPSQPRFDLAIVDEASQATLMGLIPMYLADRVIVVGDDEQVSPDAVGEDTSAVQGLVDTYLHDFPERNLFDPTYSLYEFATARFGSPIRLREHFRCAPEIIQFSNALSYRFEIQPLRDISRCERKPHVIGHKVEGTRSDGKQNRREAEEIASLVAAMCSMSVYDGASFGIISLLGDEQARLIDAILRQRIPAKEYDDRRIVCGNAYQFQGDERDIMLLSMVDSTQDGPLPLRAGGPRDMYKKRYNVAASRARDQMWVVYSLDPQSDLKPGDLRLQLISHAIAPNELMNRLGDTYARTESEFERQVAAILTGRSFAVTSQWKVGAYRIDLVVEGNGKRLAVECDGDRYHGLDRLEADMRRQEILERLGWTFVRIRGSEFFRNPHLAIQPVLQRLCDMGISPLPNVEPECAVNDVHAQVLRRAAEFRRAWAEPATSQVGDESLPDKPRRPSPFLVQIPLVQTTDSDEGMSPEDSKRTLAEIPASEIKAAIWSCLSSGALTRDELLHAVKSSLGFQRLRSRIKQRITTVVNNEVSAGRVRRIDGMLTFVKDGRANTG